MIYSVTKKYCSLKTCRIRISIFLLFNGFVLSLSASPKHAADTNYPSYHGLVMAGYQGWFHKPEKGMMYPDEKNVRIDMWPDVSEYPETYPTGLKHADLFRKLERALQRNNPVENRFARLAVAAVHAEVSIADELKALKCFCLFQTRL